MSCYEWERGSIKIPASEWAPFKKKIISAYNQIADKDYKLALTTYNYLKVAAKGKRKYKYKQSLVLKLQEYNIPYDSYTRIEQSLFPVDQERRTPLKPKKKDFVHINNQTEQLSFGHVLIGLSNQNKTFYWNVEEGNHAIDEAHRHPLVRVVFSALSQVEWKRNSGGIIVANDEYNRENEEVGGGGNYVTHAYGPLGKNLQTHKFGLSLEYI